MWTRNTSNYWIGIVISGKKLLQLLNSHTFCTVQIYFYYFYENDEEHSLGSWSAQTVFLIYLRKIITLSRHSVLTTLE